MRKNFRTLLALSGLAALSSPSLFATSYVQTNLVSDLSSVGAVTVDPNLKNPWGVSFSATSPFWVSNQATDTSTLYTGAGTKLNLTVTVPPATPPPAGPTGQVQNSAGAGNFVVNGSPASFIFDTLSGTINAWNSSTGTSATAVTTTPGAVYTGLALGNNGTANYLYAANFATGGGINVFDNTFTQVNSTTFAGKFVDPKLPAGYAPYNVQLIGSNLYVEYAEVGTRGPITGTGLGYVDVYDLNGNLVSRLISGSALNAPWGVTLAPASFGQFSNDLLVGNFGDGTINAFDPSTGAFLGTLANGNGTAIVNQGLWALDFRTNGGSGSVPNGLYFTAGINGETDGLFGYIAPAPEPSVYGLAGCGFLAIGALAWRRRRKAA